MQLGDSWLMRSWSTRGGAMVRAMVRARTAAERGNDLNRGAGGSGGSGGRGGQGSYDNKVLKRFYRTGIATEVGRGAMLSVNPFQPNFLSSWCEAPTCKRCCSGLHRSFASSCGASD